MGTGNILCFDSLEFVDSFNSWKNMDLKIVFEDSDLLVVEKPSGLLSVPGRGPEKADCVVARASSEYAWVREVHRLDQATSGLMLLARNPEVHKLLSIDFAERRVVKSYQALVPVLPSDPGLSGILFQPPETERGRIVIHQRLNPEDRPRQVIDPEKGKKAITDWVQMELSDNQYEGFRLRLYPETGRTHQLRLTLACCGAAIYGDSLYAPTDIAQATSRLMLHAEYLRVLHPLTGNKLELRSEPEF